MFVCFVTCSLFTSCGAIRPSSFVKATDGGSWSSIMIREELPYDQAFNEVLDVVARRFEMDMISKDGGYGRTNWCYTWNDRGKYMEKYRTRVIFKFSNDRKKVDIKTEDYKHISLYEDYCKMRSEGHKYEYAVAVLSKRYKISRSSVSRLIRKLGKDCQNMTLNKM